MKVWHQEFLERPMDKYLWKLYGHAINIADDWLVKNMYNRMAGGIRRKNRLQKKWNDAMSNLFWVKRYFRLSHRGKSFDQVQWKHFNCEWMETLILLDKATEHQSESLWNGIDVYIKLKLVQGCIFELRGFMHMIHPM